MECFNCLHRMALCAHPEAHEEDGEGDDAGPLAVKLAMESLRRFSNSSLLICRATDRVSSVFFTT